MKVFFFPIQEGKDSKYLSDRVPVSKWAKFNSWDHSVIYQRWYDINSEFGCVNRFPFPYLYYWVNTLSFYWTIAICGSMRHPVIEVSLQKIISLPKNLLQTVKGISLRKHFSFCPLSPCLDGWGKPADSRRERLGKIITKEEFKIWQ